MKLDFTCIWARSVAKGGGHGVPPPPHFTSVPPPPHFANCHDLTFLLGITYSQLTNSRHRRHCPPIGGFRLYVSYNKIRIIYASIWKCFGWCPPPPPKNIECPLFLQSWLRGWYEHWKNFPPTKKVSAKGWSRYAVVCRHIVLIRTDLGQIAARRTFLFLAVKLLMTFCLVSALHRNIQHLVVWPAWENGQVSERPLYFVSNKSLELLFIPLNDKRHQGDSNNVMTFSVCRNCRFTFPRL